MLFRSAEDFDETAAEALQDFMEDRGVEVDLLLGYLNKQVKDYLQCMQDDRNIGVVRRLAFPQKHHYQLLFLQTFVFQPLLVTPFFYKSIQVLWIHPP